MAPLKGGHCFFGTWKKEQLVFRSRLSRVFNHSLMLVILGLLCSSAHSSNKGPRIYTNEQQIKAWSARHSLDLEDTLSVFRHILSQLPDRVQIYPTENYYYFWFFQDGVKYAGNIRLDVDEIKRGLINFAYFRATTPWASDERDYGLVLGKKQGVSVDADGAMAWKVTFEGRSVVFALNDPYKVRLPDGLLKSKEQYLGPVFDESGMRFYLIFDQKRKLFHYILDERDGVNDEFIEVKNLKHTLLGRRTGFAFFNAGNEDRKTLIGVFGGNVDVNNQLDGPFDQLPDNFLTGNKLQQALIATRPELIGRIDRLGSSFDGKHRELIIPYVEYDMTEDLVLAEKCMLYHSDKSVRSCVDEQNTLE